MLGRILAALPAQQVLALVSDHGFEHVARAVDLKALNPPGELQAAGFLAITKDVATAAWLKRQDGVGRQIPEEELKQYAPALAGSFVFEPAEHVIFSPKIFEIGTHGYFPTRADYRSVFVLRGPGIKPGRAPERSMITLDSRLERILFSE